MSHSNVKANIIGLIFSIILTVIPFWLVMDDRASRITIISVVSICAVIQVLVHLIFFLQLDTKSSDGWNMMAIIFTAIIIMIIIVGSLWIMWNLNYNMMMSH